LTPLSRCQHHGATEERKDDLDSLKDVIMYAGKVHLVFEQLVGVKALERLWVLYELASNLESCGELSLGFSKKARGDLVGIAQDLTKKQELEGFGTRESGGGAKAGAKAVDQVLRSIKSESAKARIKEDATRIRSYIKDKGGFSAFDEHIVNHLMDVFDATKWALRCEGCKTQARDRRNTLRPLPLILALVVATIRGTCSPQASLTRLLEEALPLLIERKDAFHLLLKQVSAECALPMTVPSPITNATLATTNHKRATTA
jgi:hypothetical protein